MQLLRRSVAEALGTAFLLAAIVGSGIMAERLSEGNVAIALLANSVATGGVLVCIIAALGPVSGAHFNPAVSLADAMSGGLPWREVPAYVGAQLFGAVSGVIATNAMFGFPLVFVSHHARSGSPQFLGEFIATYGLLLVIFGCARFRSAYVPLAVAGYIVGAYWFTSSMSFANPAVTIARSLSDTFAGIRPQDASGFILAQVLGALSAALTFRWIAPLTHRDAKAVLLPHNGEPDATA